MLVRMRNRKQETGNRKLVNWGLVTFLFPVSCFLSPVSHSSEKIDTLGKEGGQDASSSPLSKGGPQGGMPPLRHATEGATL